MFAGLIAFGASATLNGDGYYRVKNYKTERYIYVLDDKGRLNFQATTAELGAIELWKGYEKAITDPATIIYVKDLTGKKQDFDLQAQGTGVYSIIDYPVSIRLADSKLGVYSIFGRNSGISRYIGDGTKSDSEQGWVTSLDNNEYYRWYIDPVTTDDSNYFAVNPSLTDGTTNYAPFFAVFPFSFHSEGMKAYTVYDVYGDKAYLKEVKGTIPGATPVIITSTSSNVSNNRLNIGGEATDITDNLLKGVYFNNSSALHLNRVAYDKNTMRVLGKLSDGTIGFKTEDIDYLPRNQAYLVVPAGSPAEIHLSTETPPARVSSITLDKTNLNLSVGEAVTLSASVLPENAANRTLEWSSTNSKIAWVNSEGRVLGQSVGEATITAKATDGSGVTATCAVKVTKALVTAITLNKSEETIRLRQTFKLTVTVAPESAEKSVTWTSEPSSVATVDGEGNVTAVSVGTALIKATATDGSNVSATCTVTVLPALAESITLNTNEHTFDVGDTHSLVATILPADAGQEVEWLSADPQTASVDDSGNMVGIAEGRTTITASTKDGSNLSAQCLVIVTDINGVSGVTSELLKVSVKNGREIVIEGADNDSVVRVLTTSGIEVYSGYDKQISGLGTGLYIVLVDDHVTKVTLK